MNLNTIKMMSIKIIIVVLIFEIDGGSICMAMTLIIQDETMLFQIVVLVFEIHSFGTIIFPLVSHLINVVTRE